MIQYIKRVEWCEAYHVHAIPDIPNQTAVLEDYAPFTELPTFDFSPMECVDTVENGQRVYSIEVSSRLANRFSLPEEPLVFRLTDIHNNQYLVGVPLLAPPYPLVTQSDKAGGRPSETGFCELRIQLKSVYPLLKILQ